MDAGGIGKALIAVGIHHVPGDVSTKRGGVHIVAPIGTMIVVSIVLTILLNILNRR